MKNSANSKTNTLLFILLDCLLVNAAAFMALLLRFEFELQNLLDSGYLLIVSRAAVPGTLVCILAFFAFHVYSSMWQFADSKDLLNVALGSVVGASLYMIAALMLKFRLPRSFPFLFAMMVFLLVCASRFAVYSITGRQLGVNLFSFGKDKSKKRTMVIGAGSGSAMVIKEFNSSEHSKNRVVCAK